MMKELLKAKAEFRKLGVALVADRQKEGAGGAWKFAGEDNVIKTIQSPLISCGLEIVSTMKDDSVKVTLWHVGSGDSIESSIKLPPVTPRKDKNGNEMYLDAEIERGKQFGYWSRILTIRILGLSDIDPEDMNNRPADMTDDTIGMRDELSTLIKNASDSDVTTAWILKNYKVNLIADLTGVQLKHVINLLIQKAKKDENPKS
jgi:hypothetical protein